jgi:FKBP-type peptidyl-prolyl cis-trans isomerase
MIEDCRYSRLKIIFAAIKISIMKKIFVCALLVTGILQFTQAQNTTKSKTTTQKTTTQKTTTTAQPVLKTLEDSANYAIGMSIANFYKQQGLRKINAALVSRAINDLMEGKPTLMSEAQMTNCVNTYLNHMQVVKSKPNIIACDQFLSTNKNKSGVITTASGLQYEVLKEGNGPKPALTDTVVCHYKGSFLNGNVFDESYTKGQPIQFALTGVISGWTEALQLMPVGSKYKLYVPYQLGYGVNDYYSIPGGSLLIFEVELVSIKGK